MDVFKPFILSVLDQVFLLSWSIKQALGPTTNNIGSVVELNEHSYSVVETFDAIFLKKLWEMYDF